MNSKVPSPQPPKTRKTFKELLTQLVMSIVFVSLFLSFTLYSIFDYLSFREMSRESFSTVAKLVSEEIKIDLNPYNQDKLANTLERTQNNKNIILTCLYQENGKIFRPLDRKMAWPECPQKIDEASKFLLNQLEILKRISYGDNQVAKLHLKYSLKDLHSLLLKKTFVALAAILLALSIAYWMASKFQSKISGPLLALANSTRTATKTGHFSVVFEEKNEGPVEVETLSHVLTRLMVQIQQREEERDKAEKKYRKLNSTLEETVANRTKVLQEVQESMVNQAHQAGRAEVATGVLHNVGNVLNSINVSAQVIAENIKNSKIVGLSKTVKIMQEHENSLATFFTNDEKGKQLPAYLTALSQYLQNEYQAISNELNSLVKNIDHIKNVIAMQQSFARKGGVTELEKLEDLVDDALQIEIANLEKDNIEIRKDYSDLPSINTDKRKVLQIIVNLISNAKYAIVHGKPGKHKLSLSTFANSPEMYSISIKDSGEGIAEETLRKIFQHGFTTKKDGHGFGLHSSAIAAKELGGTLEVKSDGPGQGATFTLSLPVL